MRKIVLNTLIIVAVGDAGELLYLEADNGLNGAKGTQVMRYDGTNVPELADPNASVSDIRDIIGYQGKLYFRATHPEYGTELFVYDGKQTALAADIYEGGGSFPQAMAVFNGKLYFNANHPDYGKELFVYDGESASLAADIDPGHKTYAPYPPNDGSPTDLTVYNAHLYFKAGNDLGGGLWKYNGSDAPERVEINSTVVYYPDDLTVFDGKLYFAANGGSGDRLWQYDGSSSVAVPMAVTGLCTRPGNLTVYNSKLYFNGYDERNSENSRGGFLCSYDGTSIHLEVDGSAFPGEGLEDLTAFGNKLYFLDEDYSLWSYDGASADNAMDIFPAGVEVYALVGVFMNKLFFTAYDDAHGEELWEYDGINPSSVIDINPGVGDSSAWADTMFDFGGHVHPSLLMYLLN